MPSKTKTGEDNPFVNNTLMRSMKGLVAHRRGSNQSRQSVIEKNMKIIEKNMKIIEKEEEAKNNNKG